MKYLGDISHRCENQNSRMTVTSLEHASTTLAKMWGVDRC